MSEGTTSIGHLAGMVDEHLLRSVVDALDGGLGFVAGDGTVMGTNRGWDAVLRTVPGGGAVCATGDDIFGLLTTLAPHGADFVTRVTDALRQVLGGDSGDRSFRGKLGTPEDPTWLVVRLHPVLDHPVARAVVTLVNVNDAMRTQQELDRYTQESKRLALVAHHTEDGVVIADSQGVVEWVNTAFSRITGLAREDVVGVSRFERLYGEYAASESFATLVAGLREGTGFVVEFETRTSTGRPYWTSLEMRAIVEDGRVTRLIGVERDVTARRQAEEQMRGATRRAQGLAAELAVEKSLLAGVISSIPHLVYWKDADLRYAGINEAFRQIRGVAPDVEVIGRTDGELSLEDPLTTMLAELEPEVVTTGVAVAERQVTVLAPGRGAVTLLLSVLPQFALGEGDERVVAGVIGVGADITRVSELERQVSQASRLEAMGQLAAGIAHEINTPVQYVSDNTRFLTDSFGEMLEALGSLEALVPAPRQPGEPMTGEPSVGRLREVLDGLDLNFLNEEITDALAQSQEGLTRVADIVRAMKEFSHPGQELGETDLNQAITSTVQISRNEWKYVAELTTDLDDSVGLVPCYAGEFKQVVLNLIVNAAQAIEERRQQDSVTDLGRIAITSRRDGDSVSITVSDDGNGMDDLTRHRIFDLFFTTKGVGKGTGQGLSHAYAVIVQKHSGTLDVVSAPGQGATFTITLPAPLWS